MSEEEYLTTYRELYTEYGQLVEAMGEREVPPLPESRSERAVVLAQHTLDEAEAMYPLLLRARQVKPPPKYVALHQAFCGFLEANVYGLRDFAEVVRTGTPEEIRVASDQHDRLMREAFEQVVREGERLQVSP